MYWKNEVLSPLSEGNKILSEGIPAKQVLTLGKSFNSVRKRFHFLGTTLTRCLGLRSVAQAELARSCIDIQLIRRGRNKLPGVGITQISPDCLFLSLRSGSVYLLGRRCAVRVFWHRARFLVPSFSPPSLSPLVSSVMS